VANFSTITWKEQVIFQWDDNDVSFVVDQHAQVHFYSAISLKQQFVGTQTHYQSLLLLFSAIVLNVEAAHINFIVFCSTGPGLESTIYHTWGEQTNYYITDAVLKICKELKTQKRWSPLNLSLKHFYNVRFTISVYKKIFCKVSRI